MSDHFESSMQKDPPFFINSMHYNIKLKSQSEKIHFVQTVQKNMTQHFSFSKERKLGLFIDKPQLIDSLTVKENIMLASGSETIEVIQKKYAAMLKKIDFESIQSLKPPSLTERQVIMVELVIHVVRNANILLIDLDVAKNQMLFKDPELVAFLSTYFKEAVKMSYQEVDQEIEDNGTAIHLVYRGGILDYEK